MATLRRRLNAIAWLRGRGVERNERRGRSYTTVELSNALAGCRIHVQLGVEARLSLSPLRLTASAAPNGVAVVIVLGYFLL